MRIDGQTDMTNLIVSFRNFAKAPTRRSHFEELLTHLPLYCVQEGGQGARYSLF